MLKGGSLSYRQASRTRLDCALSQSIRKWGKNEENIFKRFESFNKKISKSRGFWV